MSLGKSASPLGIIALFTLAYAIAVFCIGIAPLNMLLTRYMTSATRAIWLDSLGRLTFRSVEAGIACWLTLVVTGRGRGRLTSKGLIAIGALAAGVLAGAADVLVHKMLVRALVLTARSSRIAAESLSLAMTVSVCAAIMLVIVVRDVRVANTAN